MTTATFLYLKSSFVTRNIALKLRKNKSDFCCILISFKLFFICWFVSYSTQLCLKISYVPRTTLVAVSALNGDKNNYKWSIAIFIYNKKVSKSFCPCPINLKFSSTKKNRTNTYLLRCTNKFAKAVLKNN